MPATEQIIERTFGADGTTVNETLVDAPEVNEPEPEPEAEAEAAPDAGPVKVRIGDQEFANQADALAYANQIVERERLADAYSKGLLDASQAASSPTTVTPAIPAAPEFDETEYYGNPAAFLAKYGQKLVDRTLATVDQQNSLKAANDQLWSEFVEKHPELADFRADVEQCAQDNSKPLQALVAVKGRGDGYDYIASKLKERFTRQSAVLKPRRALPNSGGGASPGGTAPSVTPKKVAAEPLTMAEQIRLHKKGKR